MREGWQALAVATCLDARRFEKARQMLAEVAGGEIVRRQTLCEGMQKAAQRVDQTIHTQVAQAASAPLPPVCEPVDLYDASAPDRLWYY